MSFRIVAINPHVSVPFFAALDACDGLAWTDQAFHAVRFDTPSDAEDFGRTRIGGEDWRVVPA